MSDIHLHLVRWWFSCILHKAEVERDWPKYRHHIFFSMSKIPFANKNPFKTLDFVSLISMKSETSCIQGFFSCPFDVPWGVINPSMLWSISDHSDMHALHVRKLCGPATTQIARFMGPTWGPPGSCRPQVGPMYLAIWTCASVVVITLCLYTYIHADFWLRDLWCQATRYGDGDMSSCILYGVWH